MGLMTRMTEAKNPLLRVSRMKRELIEKRSYEGAKTGRRTEGWISGGNSANNEIVPSLSLLRNRSRELVRNNPYASKAIRSLVSNAIGIGVTPTLKRNQKLWDEWAGKDCDADGQLDLYGLEALVARTVWESGEALVRLRYRSKSDGLSVPLQIQVLEPDYLDNMKYESLPNGGWIQHGIEYNGIGRRTAYWMFSEHPGDMMPSMKGFKSHRVPASDVLHIYEKLRPGQSRGVPIGASAMLKMRDLDDYEEAELLRKGIESCFAVFVETGSEGMNVGVQSNEANTSRKLETIAAGQIEYLNNGDKVTFGNPSMLQGYNEYIRTQLHSLAVGWGVTYELLTGDMSQTNFSSSRMGAQDFRRTIEQWQWLTFVPMMCAPLMDAWLKTAWLAGSIPKPSDTVSWTTTRFDYVDPVRDVTGDLLQIAAGLKPWDDAARERGYDPDKMIANIKKTQEKFDAAGIKIQIGTLLSLGLNADVKTQPPNQ